MIYSKTVMCLVFFLGGSLVKGNFDVFSDIDLRVIVKPELHAEFVRNKTGRSKTWGEVLYFEGNWPNANYIVAHYDCFVKIDVFYYKPADLTPSLWLNNLRSLYDPHGLIGSLHGVSQSLKYAPSREEVERWRGKVYAYAHEIYRRTMRGEYSYAIKQLMGLSGFTLQAWMIEEEEFPDPWLDWSKVEGSRSILEPWQLVLLNQWHADRDASSIMRSLAAMEHELYRLNRILSAKVGLPEDRELWLKVFDMIL